MYYEIMKKRSVVAERIEELLLIKDMSVADLSRASGVDESTISNILSGARKNPRSDTVQRIAKGFPTSTDYLNGYTKDWSPNDAPPLPDFAAEVVDSMRKLDQGRNYELLLIARAFVEANDAIRQKVRQELFEELLDASDELGGEEGTNLVMKLLQELENKSRGADSGKSLPSPNEPV